MKVKCDNFSTVFLNVDIPLCGSSAQVKTKQFGIDRVVRGKPNIGGRPIANQSTSLKAVGIIRLGAQCYHLMTNSTGNSSCFHAAP